jgi:hypothetical protein
VVAKWEHARGVHVDSEHLLLLEGVQEQQGRDRVLQAQDKRQERTALRAQLRQEQRQRPAAGQARGAAAAELDCELAARHVLTAAVPLARARGKGGLGWSQRGGAVSS